VASASTAQDGGGDPPDGGRNREQNFRGEKRSNETHESITDPDARLYRKGDGRESRLCYMGHAVMENRNGLAICGEVTHATGTAEREVVVAWLDERPPVGSSRWGATRTYDVFDFVQALEPSKGADRVHRCDQA
jgi:hypothetical protein